MPSSIFPSGDIDTKHTSVLYINIRSIKNICEELEAVIYSLESPPSIICLTETWLTEDDNPKCFLVKGYNQVIAKSRKAKGGGLMIQLKQNLNFIQEFKVDLDEALHIQAGKNDCVITSLGMIRWILLTSLNAFYQRERTELQRSIAAI